MNDYIIFSGMRCLPENLIKDGDFKLKAAFPTAPGEPLIERFEFFPSKDERDKKYDLLLRQMKEIREHR